MSDEAQPRGTQDIVVDEVFPHTPEQIWKTLTSGDLISRWLMKCTGFAPVKGTRFTLQTTPSGAWDGVIQCEVLEVIPNERLVYSWRGGDDGNAGYGSRLDTMVTWTLTRVENRTRLRLVHSGFELPRNATAIRNLGEGWKKVVPKVGAMSGGDAE